MKYATIVLMLAANAALLLSTGCKKTSTTPTATIQQYEVVFDARYSTVSAMARFSPIDSGASNVTGIERITANDLVSHDSRNTTSTLYWDFTNVADVNFLYIKPSGAFRNYTSRSEMGDLYYGFNSSYDRTDTIKGTWGNSTLSGNESIIVKLSPDLPLTAGQVPGEIIATVNGSDIVFDPSATSNLAPGNYRITIIKTRVKDLDRADAPAGGNITTRLFADQLVIIR